MTTNSLVMNKPVPVSLLDTGAQGVVGTPLPRYEGALKVSGTATYAAEYPVADLAYGYMVQAKLGAGKVVKVHADGVRAVPGVIEVITDWRHFIRNAGQGGVLKARRPRASRRSPIRAR